MKPRESVRPGLPLERTRFVRRATVALAGPPTSTTPSDGSAVQRGGRGSFGAPGTSASSLRGVDGGLRGERHLPRPALPTRAVHPMTFRLWLDNSKRGSF